MSEVVRIIGGKWRGKKISFPPIADLRPTPHRVRETLFNWLRAYIVDARCLDLFAGSGALGFEALSQGAAHVTFVDKSPLVIQQLKKGLSELRIEHANVIRADGAKPLAPPPKPFDILFLDPPFKSDLLTSVCQWLNSPDFLAPNGFIYVEVSKKGPSMEFPPEWELFRSKVAGQVAYHLFRIK